MTRLSGDRLAEYHTPNGNLIILYRLKKGWASSCEYFGGGNSLVAIDDARRARELYEDAERFGVVHEAFR